MSYCRKNKEKNDDNPNYNRIFHSFEIESAKEYLRQHVNRTLAIALIEYKNRYNCSQKEIAARVGMDPAQFSRIGSRFSANLELDTIALILLAVCREPELLAHHLCEAEVSMNDFGEIDVDLTRPSDLVNPVRKSDHMESRSTALSDWESS